MYRSLMHVVVLLLAAPADHSSSVESSNPTQPRDLFRSWTSEGGAVRSTQMTSWSQAKWELVESSRRDMRLEDCDVSGYVVWFVVM